MEICIDIPDNKIGEWEIKTFEVNEENSIFSFFSYKGRIVPPGKYKKLTYKNKTIMSNTPAEISDFLPFYYHAKGTCLINGLGLGVCLKAILKKHEIDLVYVIEISKEVIDLISPYINDDRVKIIHDDAFNYQPPKNIKYNAVWHDIWNNICIDNLKEMEKLHRKYAKRTNWQDSWCKKLCQIYKKQSGI